jgi:hypothetical protein
LFISLKMYYFEDEEGAGPPYHYPRIGLEVDLPRGTEGWVEAVRRISDKYRVPYMEVIRSQTLLPEARRLYYLEAWGKSPPKPGTSYRSPTKEPSRWEIFLRGFSQDNGIPYSDLKSDKKLYADANRNWLRGDRYTRKKVGKRWRYTLVRNAAYDIYSDYLRTMWQKKWKIKRSAILPEMRPGAIETNFPREGQSFKPIRGRFVETYRAPYVDLSETPPGRAPPFVPEPVPVELILPRRGLVNKKIADSILYWKQGQPIPPQVKISTVSGFVPRVLTRVNEIFRDSPYLSTPANMYMEELTRFLIQYAISIEKTLGSLLYQNPDLIRELIAYYTNSPPAKMLRTQEDVDNSDRWLATRGEEYLAV